MELLETGPVATRSRLACTSPPVTARLNDRSLVTVPKVRLASTVAWKPVSSIVAWKLAPLRSSHVWSNRSSMPPRLASRVRLVEPPTIATVAEPETEIGFEPSGETVMPPEKPAAKSPLVSAASRTFQGDDNVTHDGNVDGVVTGMSTEMSRPTPLPDPSSTPNDDASVPRRRIPAVVAVGSPSFAAASATAPLLTTAERLTPAGASERRHRCR